MLASLLALTATSCTRSPPEPASSAASSRAPSANAGTDAPSLAVAAQSPTAASSGMSHPATAIEGRCVKPLPETPPPQAKPASDAACPKDPAPQTFTTAKLELPSEASGSLKALTVELARTTEETSRGLMYRREMPEDRGMLFDLRNRRKLAFWMKNTCLPLDMMFIDDDGLVVGILEQVPVLNLDERSVDCPARYVLEVNAGFSRRHGIRPGQKLKLP